MLKMMTMCWKIYTVKNGYIVCYLQIPKMTIKECVDAAHKTLCCISLNCCANLADLCVIYTPGCVEITPTRSLVSIIVTLF